MSASKRWGILSGMMLLAAVLLGATWWIACMALGVGMLINGPYLIALLCALLGVAFAWASVRAERLERIAERARHHAVQRAVRQGAREGGH